jgi:hypothetical protein
MGAVGIAAGVAAAGSIAGSAISSSAASDAADVQSKAQLTAASIQQQEFKRIMKMLQPYNRGGQNAFKELQLLTGTNPGGNPLKATLTKPFLPTMKQLQQTPGYEFAKTQGLQATQNSFAAEGLGQSGAALKGAANYAEGLASTTYQQQFDNYLKQNLQISNILSGQAGLGENAAAMAGNTGATVTSNITGAITGAAAAQAGGIVGSANALSAGIGGLGNAATLYALGNNSGLFGGSGSGSSHGVIANDTGGSFNGG